MTSMEMGMGGTQASKQTRRLVERAAAGVASSLLRRTTAVLAPFFGLALAGACDAGAPAPRAPRPEAAQVAVPPGEGKVTVVRSKSQVPLRGPRVDAEPGDFLIEKDGLVAVVSTEHGSLVDFGPSGAEDALSFVSPSIFDGLGGVRAPVVLAGEAAPGVVRMEHRASTLPVRLVTFLTFRGAAVLVESIALPEDGYADRMAVGIGERINWGNLPTWVEGAGFVPDRGGTFSARFLGREGPGLSYALALEDGTRTYARFSSVSVPGFYAQARGSEMIVTDPSGSMRRRLLVAVSDTSLGDAAMSLGLAGARVPIPKSLPPGGRAEIAACKDRDEPRKPFARFAPSDGVALVPEGCFEGRLVAPGHAATEWMKPEALATAVIPPSGTISVRVTEGGAPVPARLQVRGRGDTPDPAWGEDPDGGAALNAVSMDRGETSRPVPPGTYRVIVDRGFEYSVHDANIEVRAGERTEVDARLERVVDTKGWLASDLHLHAAPSPDAPQSLAERVRSLAATGVEVGVATDHNRVTDYGPAIRELDLGKHVAAVIGDEVTTEEMGFGHFNVFPLAAGSAPLRYQGTNPNAIFREARGRAPRFETNVLQVNHPRMGEIGYFDVIRLDRKHIPAFESRRPGWLAFDALEVYNGDDVVDLKNVESCMLDWFALLDAGYRVTATGNSDSHKLTFHEPGLPRTYVSVPVDDPARFDENAFISAVRAGKVMVSGGPFVRLAVAGKGPGESVPPGRTQVEVAVDAPPWIDVTVVELLVRGKVVETKSEPFEAGDHRATLRAEVDLRAGDWVIAVTRGERTMAPLFRRGVLPFAFTNAVFVE
jgi:hypothetical protein